VIAAVERELRDDFHQVESDGARHESDESGYPWRFDVEVKVAVPESHHVAASTGTEPPAGNGQPTNPTHKTANPTAPTKENDRATQNTAAEKKDTAEPADTKVDANAVEAADVPQGNKSAAPSETTDGSTRPGPDTGNTVTQAADATKPAQSMQPADAAPRTDVEKVDDTAAEEPASPNAQETPR
jgi:hypothetical protein